MRWDTSSLAQEHKHMRPEAGWRRRLYDVIFGHESGAGKAFDVVLIFAILASVLAVILDSVATVSGPRRALFRGLEWGFTVAFTLEYLLRLSIVRRPARYARSFYGVVDVLSFLPTYISLLVPGAQYLLVIRVLRILRIFRVLKLVRYVGEADLLFEALVASRRKIFIFIFSVLTLVVIFGALMYLIEGPEHGFSDIPTAMYWAIVTLTTVGYGDVSPVTPLGQSIASMIMITGYGIIAVPTGIYTAELAQVVRRSHEARECRECGLRGHDSDAGYCRRCGNPLEV